MAHVGSVDPWNAGDGGPPPEVDPGSGLGATPAPATEFGQEVRADLLMGFLADFHAAGRRPEPEPESEPVRPVPSTTSASYLSRFDFVPPDPLDVVEDLPPAAPLPVWPPPPDAAAPGRLAASAGPPSAEPPAAVPPRPPAGPEPDNGQGQAEPRAGVNVFRRLGRR